MSEETPRVVAATANSAKVTQGPRVGKGKRNPTRWLVGIEGMEDPDYREVRAVGAKAAVDVYVTEFDPGMSGDIVVWPLRPGSGPELFTVSTKSVTQTTITEAT